MLIGRPPPPLVLPGVHAGKVDAFDVLKMRGSWVVVACDHDASQRRALGRGLAEAIAPGASSLTQ